MKALFETSPGLGLALSTMRTSTGYTPLALAVRARNFSLAGELADQAVTGLSTAALEGFCLARDKHGKNIFNICCWNGCGHLLDVFLARLPAPAMGQALANPAGAGTPLLGKWAETPLMHRNIPEPVILRCWPLLERWGRASHVSHQVVQQLQE